MPHLQKIQNLRSSFSKKNEKGAIAEEVSVNEISDEYSFPSGATVTKDTEGAYVFNNLPSEGYSINVLLNMDASEKNGKVLSETARYLSKYKYIGINKIQCQT